VCLHGFLLINHVHIVLSDLRNVLCHLFALPSSSHWWSWMKRTDLWKGRCILEILAVFCVVLSHNSHHKQSKGLTMLSFTPFLFSFASLACVSCQVTTSQHRSPFPAWRTLLLLLRRRNFSNSHSKCPVVWKHCQMLRPGVIAIILAIAFAPMQLYYYTSAMIERLRYQMLEQSSKFLLSSETHELILVCR